LQLAPLTDDLYRLRQTQGGLDEAVGDRRRQGVRDPDYQPQGTSRRPPLERVLKLAPQGEDLVRVPGHDPPGLRQHEVPPGPADEPGAQGFLQGPQLRTDGGLRQVELAAGAGDAPLPRNRPEVEQVVVTEPGHASQHTSVFSMIQRRRFNEFWET